MGDIVRYRMWSCLLDREANLSIFDLMVRAMPEKTGTVAGASLDSQMPPNKKSSAVKQNGRRVSTRGVGKPMEDAPLPLLGR